MRLQTVAALSTALLLAACGADEGEKLDTQTTTVASQGAPPVAGVEAEVPDVSGAPGAAAPITGTILEVRMIGDSSGYRFEPQHVTAKSGDGVKFVVISGAPHEVAFDLGATPAEWRERLLLNMPNATNGRSPLLVGEGETWTVSLGGLGPGKYPFVSTPRLPQGMKGEIEIP